MSNDIETMKAILASLDEALSVIEQEVHKCWARVQLLKDGLATIEQDVLPIPGVGTVNPLDAPEIMGADKDGDGGFAVSIGQAPREEGKDD